MTFDEESEKGRARVSLAALRWLGPAVLPFVLVPLAVGSFFPSSFLWAQGIGLMLGAVSGFFSWKRPGNSPLIAVLGGQLSLSCALMLLIGLLVWGSL